MMRKILLSFFVLLTTLAIHAQIVNIPDANFKNALLTHNPVIDLNADGQIQVSEAVAFTGTINVQYKNIANLTGINAFANITGLICAGNSLTSFILNNFPSLQLINCSGNAIGPLQLSNLPALTELNLDLNRFLTQYTLSLNNLPALKIISCWDCRINTLLLSNLNSLEFLYCPYSLSGTLFLNNLPSLSKVDCSWGNLTSISITGSNALKELNCTLNNNLTSITLSNPGILEKLYCARNKLTALPASLNSLRILDCSENLLTSIPVNNSNALDSLDISRNLFTSFTLTNKPQLRTLFCSRNQLTSITLSNLPRFKRLDCSFNKLTSLTMSGYDSLYSINCSDNLLTNLSLSNLPALWQIYATNNKLTSLAVNDLPSLEWLNCDRNQLSSLTVNNLPALKYLICSDNPLTSISLNNFPSLDYVSCSNNQLTELDLRSTAVTSLDCAGNPNLLYINVKNNSISANPVYSSFTGLTLLQSVCVDDAELAYMTSLVHSQLPGQNVSVSSFCNFNPNGNYNTITGAVRFDGNANGCNNLDSGMNNLRMNIDDGVQTGATFTNAQGNYKFHVGLNNNIINPFVTNTWFTSTPSSQAISFSTYGNGQVADFCITPVGIHPDLEIALLPVSTARPGFDANYKLVYRNKGNQVQSGTVTLSFNNIKLNFISSIPPPTNQATGSLSWTYTGLSPYETRVINLIFHVNTPPVVNAGDILSFDATVNPVAGDETPVDNLFHLDQIVRSSFDPNDKQVTEGSQISIDKLGEYLHYVIRFQNIGTANAISVIVKDSLSANLDWNSFEPIIASHPYRTVITKGNLVEFIFDGINLPPKSINEPASNGFVSFKIKPKSNLVVGDAIQNRAGIYFDFNLPIVTNTVTTTIYKLNNSNIAGLTVYPNPTKDWLSFSVNPGVEIKAINLFNMMGQKMNVKITESSATNRKIDVSNFANGVYFLELISNLGKLSQKVMIVK